MTSKTEHCCACNTDKPVSAFASSNNLSKGNYRRCNACRSAGVKLLAWKKTTKARFVSHLECPPLPLVNNEDTRHCPGYIGLAVTSSGIVWSCYNKAGWRMREWRRLPAGSVARGYVRVSYQGHTLPVAYLVAIAFHGPRPGGMEIRHKDGCRTNNRAENIEWGTHSENEMDKRRHGTSAACENNPSAKLTNQVVAEIKQRRRNGASRKQLASEFGIPSGTIENVIYGRHWREIA